VTPAFVGRVREQAGLNHDNQHDSAGPGWSDPRDRKARWQPGTGQILSTVALPIAEQSGDEGAMTAVGVEHRASAI
jgi:hypothetical protein